MDSKPFTLDRTVRLIISLSILVALFLITRQLSGVLVPFLVSWFIAYLLHPLVCFLQYKCRLKHRGVSVILALLLVIIVLIGILVALISPITNEVMRMAQLVSEYVGGIEAQTILPDAWEDALRQWLSELDLTTWLSIGSVSAFVEKVTPYLGSLVNGSLSFISSLFVVFVCVLYVAFILIDYEKISEGFIRAIPPKYRDLIVGIKSDLEVGMNKYFRGQSLIASIVGVLFAIGFYIMGLPMAIVVGLFIGMLNLIPYMQVVGIPLTMFLGLLQSAETGTAYWIILLEIFAVFVVVQGIQDIVLNPFIMGNVIGMKPAIMLLSLSVWASLLGVAGMIIALPITTVIISYYKRFVLGENASCSASVEQAPLSTESPATPSAK